MFSASSLLSLYASFCTFFMFLQNAYHELVPYQLKSYLFLKLSHFFSLKKPQTSLITLVIDDSWEGYNRNKLIKASNTYLSTKIGPKNRRIRVGKFKKTKNVITSLVDGEEVVDIFDGIKITWHLGREDHQNNNVLFALGKHFEVTFEEKYKDKVVSEYFSHVLHTHEEMKNEEKGLKIYSLVDECWEPFEFSHPAFFRTLAMDSELKKVVMDDLDRFLGRKEYYKRVGKAWKRCYLLYGPPGAGKSSLVAAMANYLKFDIYELELSNIFYEFDLRELLLDIEGNSIIVIEDINCNSGPSETELESNEKEPEDENNDGEDRCQKKQVSAADVLRCIEGLWAKSEEQRIVVLTTNHKEVLEAGLDVPGQIDMHIQMSYCTVQGFRILALNYLGIEQHSLFEEIDKLIQSTEVTPASLAEELLRNDDADTALSQVINFLQQKKIENSTIDQAYIDI